MPDSVNAALSLGASALPWRTAAHGVEVGPATVLAVLRALVAMARGSRRHEADVESALRGAGLVLEPDLREQALRQLLDAGCIERVVTLADGGTLASVTASGMNRAAQHG